MYIFAFGSRNILGFVTILNACMRVFFSLIFLYFYFFRYTIIHVSNEIYDDNNNVKIIHLYASTIDGECLTRTARVARTGHRLRSSWNKDFCWLF